MKDVTEDNDLIEGLCKATREVFSLMLMVELEDDHEIGGRVTDSEVTSMIGLGGGIRGVLRVHCTREAGIDITAEMLGMEISELGEDVKDALGEIANMIAGGMKDMFVSKGIDVQLAIPTTVIGKKYRTSGASKARTALVPFDYKGHGFWVEFEYVLNPGE